MEQPIDITRFLAGQPREVRIARAPASPVRMVPASNAKSESKNEAPEEQPHTTGTRFLFSGATGFSTSSSAPFLAFPQTEVGAYVTAAIIEELNMKTRIEFWIPPTVRPRRKLL